VATPGADRDSGCSGFPHRGYYSYSDSAGRVKERTTATTPTARGKSKSNRQALDNLLLEYSPKLREAVIELSVRGRTVDWELRPDIRGVLDHVAELCGDAMRQQAVSLSELTRGNPPRQGHQSEATEPRPDIDPDVEVIKKMIGVLKPDLTADAKARLIDHYLAMRDREEFRQEK
jgi:hypothetical protein